MLGNIKLFILALFLIVSSLACIEEDNSKVKVDPSSSKPSNYQMQTSNAKESIPKANSSQKLNEQSIEAKVVEVIDGDTIEVSVKGLSYKVRYIGVDTPETKHPRKGLEYFGPEASAYNKKLVEGKTVTLVKDVSETDKYDRLLRYVFVGDLFINAKLVKEGYANASAYPPDVKYDDKFRELERYARDNNKGLWAPKPEETPEASEDGQCEPGYSPCVPKYPPDLDCPDIGQQVEVTGSDPHGLDRDGDGVGCESY